MEKQNEVVNGSSGEIQPKIVSQSEWIDARKQLLIKEKELTRLNDDLARRRRELPWVKVENNYIFEGPMGQETLSDLFAGNSQLIIYHFMFAPGWEEGCPGCSFIADHIDGANLHLAHHDVSVVVVSRAPLAEILPFKKRMDWKFKWVSSFGSDFNYDYNVSFTDEQIAEGEVYYNYAKQETGSESPGTSVFYRNSTGQVFHTYSTYSRGGDILIGAHNFLDLTPKGRNEKGTMDWLRHHDKYEKFNSGSSCCH